MTSPDTLDYIATQSSWDQAFTQFLNSLMAQESGGDYTFIQGNTSADPKLGAYQVPLSLVKKWSKQFLGYEVSEQQFLSDRALQDMLVQAELLNTYSQIGASSGAGQAGSGDFNITVAQKLAAYWLTSVAPTGDNTPVSQQVDTIMQGMAKSGTTLGDMGLGMTAQTSITPGTDPNIALAQLRSNGNSQATLIAALITHVPELQSIWQEWLKVGGSDDWIISKVQNSKWWQDNSATARQQLALYYTDPATYNQNVDNLQASLQNFASQLGVTLTDNMINHMAVDALYGGYDNNQNVLRQKMMDFLKPVSGLHYGGEAGSTENTLRQAMLNMGVQLPEGTLDSAIQRITGGLTDSNSVIAQLRTQAAAKYPAYANLINAGVNVSDIADPYIQQARNLLEEGTGSINMQTPMVQRALQYRDPTSGQPAPMPLYAFENQVRDQPDWLKTQNAQDSFMSTAHKILQDFGFNY